MLFLYPLYDPASLRTPAYARPRAALADLETENLPSALVFGAGSGVVVGAWLDGKHVCVPDDTGG
jgi:formimidoylglutamate deiminase